MKIGIDISQVVYGTGVSNYTKNLVRALLKIDKNNEYVLFFSSLRRKVQSAKCKVQSDKAKLKTFKFPPLLLEFIWNRLHIFSIEKLVGKVDVFHTSDWLEPPAQCPKVTTIHDLVVYKYPETLHPRIVANQRRKIEWVKKESKIIITVSESTKKDMMEILGIPGEKIRVIYEAPDPDFKKVEEKQIGETRRKFGVPKEYLLAVGADPRKNIALIIKALLLIPQSPPLVIVGKRWNLPSMSDGWPSNIIWLGQVPSEELAALYSGAQALIYASLYEGFGLPILEAMACGCPVVTSNVSSLPEIAGKAAILVNPLSVEEIAEGVKKALVQRQELTRKGLIQVKKFSWEKTALETLKVYHEATRM